MKLLLPFTKAVGRILKVRVDAKNDTDKSVERGAIDRALLRKRLQLERNSRALAETQTSLLQGRANDEADCLRSIFDGVAQHTYGNGSVGIESFQGVVGEVGRRHSASPAKAPTVSAVTQQFVK